MQRRKAYLPRDHSAWRPDAAHLDPAPVDRRGSRRRAGAVTGTSGRVYAGAVGAVSVFRLWGEFPPAPDRLPSPGGSLNRGDGGTAPLHRLNLCNLTDTGIVPQGLVQVNEGPGAGTPFPPPSSNGILVAIGGGAGRGLHPEANAARREGPSCRRWWSARASSALRWPGGWRRRATRWSWWTRRPGPWRRRRSTWTS